MRVQVWSTARAPNPAAEEVGIGAQASERREGCPEEDRQERRLVGAHEPPQLRGEREDDVEVGDRQEQLSLLGEPPRGGIVSAPWTGAVTTRVIEQVLALAPRALREMAAHLRRAAAQDGLHGVHVAGQQGGAMALHVGRTVPPKDVGEPEHGSGLSLQIDHEAVEGLLEALGAGLGDVHVELGGAHGLVAEHVLDSAQRDACFEQVGGVAVTQGVD